MLRRQHRLQEEKIRSIAHGQTGGAQLADFFPCLLKASVAEELVRPALPIRHGVREIRLRLGPTGDLRMGHWRVARGAGHHRGGWPAVAGDARRRLRTAGCPRLCSPRLCARRALARARWRNAADIFPEASGDAPGEMSGDSGVKTPDGLMCCPEINCAARMRSSEAGSDYGSFQSRAWPSRLVVTKALPCALNFPCTATRRVP